MIDRYTKIVMTVIAISTSIIAVRGVVAPAKAQFDDGPCGAITNPCYIDFYSKHSDGFPMRMVE